MEFATPRPSFVAPADPNVFRPHKAIRASSAVGIAVTGSFATLTGVLAFLADTKIETAIFWFFTVLLGCTAVALHRTGLYPFVALEDRGVRVRNLFSEHLLEWHDIAAVRPGYWGMTFTLRSRRPVCAFALQKSNMAIAKGMHETASDLAARTIMQRAAGDPTHPGLALPTEAEQKKAQKTARIVIGICAGYLVLRSLADLAT
jgi:hypothetical protein